jgi:hypothetical protein
VAPAPRRQPAAPPRCAACGIEGRLSLADPRPDDHRPVLRLTWGYLAVCRLLCDACRKEIDA